MKTRILLIAVPLLMALGFIGSRALLGSTDKLAADVVQPASDEPGFSLEPLTDDQGSVSVAVTQMNLNTPGETLDFQVEMDTHSVDLSMDLTTAAVLTTETGITLTPLKWDAPPGGGHHVSGVLSFPASSLAGAAEIRLVIRNVDAPERVFVWKWQNSR